MTALGWLADGSERSVAAALARVAPQLANLPISNLAHIRTSNPLWCSGTAVVGDRYLTKFAWSQPAAEAVHRDIRMTALLRAWSPSLGLARLVARSNDPVLLVSEVVAGSPLTLQGAAVVGPDGQEVIGAEIGRWLAVLHSAQVLGAMEKAGLDDREPTPQADTAAIRTQFVAVAPSRWTKTIHSWCDWADATLLDAPRRRCVLHGDFHGHNQIWDPSLRSLRAVVDFEESGVGDAAYDFRYLPAQAPGLVLLNGAVAEYEKRTGTTVDLQRVMAWHICTVLGDALWRTEAGVALPDGGTIVAWLEQLCNRIRAAGGT